MKFTDLEFNDRGSLEGKQALVFFENGYGASIVRGPYTYGGADGLFEIAVLEGPRGKSAICYDSGLTEDVEGHLSETDVTTWLERIEALSTKPDAMDIAGEGC